MALTRKQAEEFFSLVDKINAKGFDNADRVIGRIEMGTFIAKHGRAACDALYNATVEKAKAKKPKAAKRKKK